MKKKPLWLLCLLWAVVTTQPAQIQAQPASAAPLGPIAPASTAQSFDIVVYGGTSAGISSAIQSSRLGKKVVLIEPGNRIGGLTTGGLGQTDIGNKQAIGGISREFYQNVKSYYQQPGSWTWQKRETYRDGGQTTSAANEDAMWTFEPSAALKIYKDMLSKEKNITLIYSQRLNRKTATYEEREKIAQRHKQYQQGLMWTLAYHPRIPAKVREVVSKWGTCKDEYESKDGWSPQLYVREARRMIGEYVMTQKNCEKLEVVEDPVGLGAYGMDSHHVQRYVDVNGYVKNEGNVEAHVASPFPISYRSIVPKKSEASNLFVPICLSASHIAFGSIRMEPVFMVLGQSAAIAASMAIDNNYAVQDIPYKELQVNLLKNKQVLH